MLDYSIEVEHYDNHLGKIVAYSRRPANSTHVDRGDVDHGLPFPRVKGQAYDLEPHSAGDPLAKGYQRSGRVVTDFVSFADLAPTFIEAAGDADRADRTANHRPEFVRHFSVAEIGPRDRQP